MTSNPASKKAIALLLLVFGLGVVFGALGLRLMSGRVYGARTAPRTQSAGDHRVVNRLTHDLDLTPDQQTQVSNILTGMQVRYNAIRQQMNPQFDEVRSQGREQMRQILTPEQRPKLDEFFRQVDEERRRRNPR
jgi:Spy/CpxP family protein refolding chaperone